MEFQNFVGLVEEMRKKTKRILKQSQHCDTSTVANP